MPNNLTQIKNLLLHYESYELPELFIDFKDATENGAEAILHREEYLVKQFARFNESEKERFLQMLIKKTTESLSNDEEITHPVAEKLGHYIQELNNKYPGKKAFIIMKFEDTRIHKSIVVTIKEFMKLHNITALRADEKRFGSLFDTVQVYMHACDFGIAVFDRLSTNDFNPNVSLEVGYMLGLGKKVCYLKDKTLVSLHTDIIGEVYDVFDTQNVKPSINTALTNWLNQS